jgi:hypothetical protein
MGFGMNKNIGWRLKFTGPLTLFADGQEVGPILVVFLDLCCFDIEDKDGSVVRGLDATDSLKDVILTVFLADLQVLQEIELEITKKRRVWVSDHLEAVDSLDFAFPLRSLFPP